MFYSILFSCPSVPSLSSLLMAMSILPVSSVHTVFICEAWSPKVSVFPPLLFCGNSIYSTCFIFMFVSEWMCKLLRSLMPTTGGDNVKWKAPFARPLKAAPWLLLIAHFAGCSWRIPVADRASEPTSRMNAIAR